MINWPLMLKAWVISLTMTLILELSYALFWGIRDKRDLSLTALVNILTNPIVVFSHYFIRFRRYPATSYGWVSLGTEALAFAAEALLYQKFARTITRPWLFSLSANAFSYAVGELINKIM